MTSTTLSLETVNIMAAEAGKLRDIAVDMNEKAISHVERIREITDTLKQANQNFMALGQRLATLGPSKENSPQLEVIENPTPPAIQLEKAA